MDPSQAGRWAPAETARPTATVLAPVSLVLLLALAGCWSSRVGIAGVARATTVRCAGQQTLPAPPGLPLADARITVRCPGEPQPRHTEITDGQGRFFVEVPATAMLAAGCEITVERDGYYPRRFTMEEVCDQDGLPECQAGSVFAELVPVRAPAEPAPDLTAAPATPAPSPTAPGPEPTRPPAEAEPPPAPEPSPSTGPATEPPRSATEPGGAP